MNEPTMARKRSGITQDAWFVDRRHTSVRRAGSRHATGEPESRRAEQMWGDCEARLHEVRASLAAVSAAVHALTTPELVGSDSRGPEIARMLEDEVDRLKRLVTPEDLPHQERAEQRDLDELIESVVLLRRITGHQVTWAPSGHRFAGPPDEIVEVLNILLVNAARHAPGAPAHVSVLEDDGVIRVRVSDEGPGVREELRGSLFDRGTRDPVTGGTGVGLSIASSLVEGLGGTLALRDRSGDGASFEMIFPLDALGGAA